MTQKEKDLLLKDICGRLPYGIKFPYHMEKDCNHRGCNCVAVIESISEDRVEFTYEDNCYTIDWSCSLFLVKPYLRPMSSMTDEEKKEFDDFCVIDEFAWDGNVEIGYKNQAIIMSDAIDWLNKNHFDYRGLIEKCLALEAPEGMYKK